MFYRAEFLALGKVWSLLGAYIGICFDVIYYGGTPPTVNKTGSIGKAFLRIAVCMVVALPYILINRYLRLTDWVNSYAIEQLLKEALPSFLWMVFAFSYLRLLLLKCGLVSGEKAKERVSEM